MTTWQSCGRNIRRGTSGPSGRRRAAGRTHAGCGPLAMASCCPPGPPPNWLAKSGGLSRHRLEPQPVAERAGDGAAQRGAASAEAGLEAANPAQTRRDSPRRVTMKCALVGGPGASSAIPWPWKSGRERWALRSVGRGRLRDIPHAAPTPAMPRMRRHGPAARRDVHLGRQALHDMRRRTAAPQVGRPGISW